MCLALPLCLIRRDHTRAQRKSARKHRVNCVLGFTGAENDNCRHVAACVSSREQIRPARHAAAVQAAQQVRAAGSGSLPAPSWARSVFTQSPSYCADFARTTQGAWAADGRCNGAPCAHSSPERAARRWQDRQGVLRQLGGWRAECGARAPAVCPALHLAVGSLHWAVVGGLGGQNSTAQTADIGAALPASAWLSKSCRWPAAAGSDSVVAAGC